MAGRGRLVIALLAGLVIFSAIPHSNAESTDSVDIEIHTNQLNDYYLAGDTLNLLPSLYNPSSTQQIDNNPSCDYVFDIYDADEVHIFSSAAKCRNQLQSIEITQEEYIRLMPHDWDFVDNTGLDIASGQYQVVITHSTLEITDTTTFEYYANTTLPNEIALRYNLVDISSEYSSAYLLQTFIHNPTSEKIDLNGHDCTIILENDLQRHILDGCLENTRILHPYENFYSGYYVLDSAWFDGTNAIEFSFLGDSQKHQLKLQQSPELDPSAEQQTTKPDIELIDYELVNEVANPYVSILAQPGNFDTAEITDCDMNLFIVDDYGEIVKNEVIDFCDTYAETTQTVGDDNQVAVYQWDLLNQDNCLTDFGRYTVILESEQFSTVDFFQSIPNDSVECNRNNIEIAVENNMIDNSLYTTVRVSADQNIRVFADCTVIIDVVFESNEMTNLHEEFCDYNSGNFFTPPDGVYLIEHKINLPQESVLLESINVNHKVNFEYTSIHTESILMQSNSATEVVEATYLVSGTWDLIEVDNGECWMISAPNSAYILHQDSVDSVWSPKIGWYGEYSVQETQLEDNLCSQFGLPVITITEVFVEENPHAEQENLVSKNDEITNSISITQVTVVGVASSSILIALLAVISNTESLRIPVTSAGLWMLALVGKTHETSDGKFQRGRLIGYLTANPGCHFRALMAALGMSNGQITHHLRLLENQELIWRINDGRFVRYYPLNNSLYPGMNPDDLPVPPLSPDPRSLQGKILTILDDEHQLGEFPTQAELAYKLEKSQQLISHHLRTLQKYGLVEKRKMGIKNRYKLTKEALFLLETDIEYLKVRD